MEEIKELNDVGPARAGGHDLHREVRAPLDPAQEGGDQARGAEREVPRARGRDRGPGRPLRRRDHRHQHGRPRHRHHPGRRARPPGEGHPRSRRRSTPSRPRPSSAPGRRRPGAVREMAGDFKKALAERKPTAEEREDAGQALPGPPGRFAPDHPSVEAVRALARQGLPAPAAYLDTVRDLPRATRRRSPSLLPADREAGGLPGRPSPEGRPRGQSRAPGSSRRSRSSWTRTSASGWWPWAASTSWPPSATRPAASTTSSAAARAARATPGSSRFYLSLEDDLMRIFGSDRISGLMLKLGMEEGVPIEHGMVTRSIERAQKQVEAQNFAVRKHLLEYDDVMNKQRTAVYDMRRMVLEGKDTREHVLTLAEEVLDWYLDNYCPEKDRTRATGTWRACSAPSRRPSASSARSPSCGSMGRPEMLEGLVSARPRPVRGEGARWSARSCMLFHQRMIMLQIVDTQWKDHLYSLDHLKEGIGLRGYGQRDPLVEYKKESFSMFQALMDRIDEEILRWIFLYQPVAVAGSGRGNEEADERPLAAPPSRAAHPRGGERDREPELALAGARAMPRNLTFNDPDRGAARPSPRPAAREAQGGSDEVQTVRREGKKVGRNDPCPCGSGKKYKKCHGGLSLGMLDERIPEALTFDDVLLVPQKSDVLPAEVDVSTRLTRRIVAQDPHRVGGHGHGHRGPARHRHGPGRRHRDHPQEHVHRGPGPGGGQGQALRVRDDRGPGDRGPRRPGGRRPRRDGQVTASAASRSPWARRLVGILTNRDLRFETRTSLPVSELMTKENLITVPVGTTLEQAKEILHRTRSRSCWWWTGLQPEGPDHRQGHPEADQVPERLQGLPGPAAGGGRRRRHPGRARPRRRPRRGQGGRGGRGHRPRPHHGRARHGRGAQEALPGPRGHRGQRGDPRRRRRPRRGGRDRGQGGHGSGLDLHHPGGLGRGHAPDHGHRRGGPRRRRSRRPHHRRRRHQVLGRHGEGHRRRRLLGDDRLALRGHRREPGRADPAPGPLLQELPRHGLHRGHEGGLPGPLLPGGAEASREAGAGGDRGHGPLQGAALGHGPAARGRAAGRHGLLRLPAPSASCRPAPASSGSPPPASRRATSTT